jgi:hypothetical protein
MSSEILFVERSGRDLRPHNLHGTYKMLHGDAREHIERGLIHVVCDGAEQPRKSRGPSAAGA